MSAQFNSFEEASQYVSNNKEFIITDDEKLMLYALYKMATVGKPNKHPPNPLNITETSKFTAWSQFSETYNCADATTLYTNLVNKLYIKYLCD